MTRVKDFFCHITFSQVNQLLLITWSELENNFKVAILNMKPHTLVAQWCSWAQCLSWGAAAAGFPLRPELSRFVPRDKLLYSGRLCSSLPLTKQEVKPLSVTFMWRERRSACEWGPRGSRVNIQNGR